MEFQVAFRGASHERLGGYPAKFDMEFHPFATLEQALQERRLCRWLAFWRGAYLVIMGKRSLSVTRAAKGFLISERCELI
jgi:hypothetical protein